MRRDVIDAFRPRMRPRRPRAQGHRYDRCWRTKYAASFFCRTGSASHRIQDENGKLKRAAKSIGPRADPLLAELINHKLLVACRRFFVVVETLFFFKRLRYLSVDRRKMMIDPDRPQLSIMCQCKLASISRSSCYREPTEEEVYEIEQETEQKFTAF